MLFNRNQIPAAVFFATLFSLLICGGIYTLWPGAPRELWWMLLYVALPTSLLSLIITMLLVIMPLRRNVDYLSDEFGSLLTNNNPKIFDMQFQDQVCSEELVPLCTSIENLWQTVREQEKSLNLLQNVYESSLDAIIVSDAKTNEIIDCNPKARFMLGFSKEELIGKPLDELARNMTGEASNFRKQILDKGYAWFDELLLITKSNKKIPVEVSSSPLETEESRLLVSFMRDISERKEAEQRISHLAYHDSLTNLPNRALLSDRIGRAIVKAKRTDTSGAVMFLDLDKFKRINDSLGHDVGDELLKEVAHRLAAALRAEDTISRLGGDEFVVVVENIAGYEKLVKLEIKQIADKVREKLAQPYKLGEHELQVTSSIGVTIFPTQGDKVDDLLKQADIAMYHAKESGRDHVEFFAVEMEESTTNRLQLENRVRLGMDAGQFKLYYQPIVEINSGLVTGAEALIRWQQPDKSLMTPADFFSTLENSRLLIRIDNWVLEESLRFAQRIQESGIDQLEVLSINISKMQFHQPRFIKRIQEALENNRLTRNIIQFEITEPTIQVDIDDSVLKLGQLKHMGIHLAVDRFGTGYSSMSWLKKLPLDTIKLDRSFVAGIGKDRSDEMVIDTALSMARHMNLSAVAEGVETAEQLKFLQSKECAKYQGYYHSKPIPEDEFLSLLQRQTAELGKTG
ncbi:MAG: EAL domain-containing protein [bacterium]